MKEARKVGSIRVRKYSVVTLHVLLKEGADSEWLEEKSKRKKRQEKEKKK